MDELDLAKLNRNAWRREQYRLDGGKRKAENQAWKDSHREQVRAASREYQRQRRLLDPEASRAASRKSRAKDPAKWNARTREWFKKHPNYHKVKVAEYRKKDPVRFMLRNAKNRAKAMGLPFDLTREDITIPEHCPVLGTLLVVGSRPFSNPAPTLDRLNNGAGYVSGNVHVISWRANAIKRDATLAELKAVVAYVERHSGTS